MFSHFAHASQISTRYIVAMSKGTDFYLTEIMLIHDGTTEHNFNMGFYKMQYLPHLMQTSVVQMLDLVYNC